MLWLKRAGGKMSDEITVSINDVSHSVLCGVCKEPIAFIGEANVETGEAGCVPCGNLANIQEVVRMTFDYAKDEGQIRLNRHARDVASKVKFMKFSGQTEHDKTHRFVVDLKL